MAILRILDAAGVGLDMTGENELWGNSGFNFFGYSESGFYDFLSDGGYIHQISVSVTADGVSQDGFHRGTVTYNESSNWNAYWLDVVDIQDSDGNDVLYFDAAETSFIYQKSNVWLEVIQPKFWLDGDDEIYGNRFDDWIDGQAGDDLIIAGWGDDTIVGGTGNDTIDGGGKVDTAIFDGPQNAFTVTLNASETTVSDRRPVGQGTDTLRNVERLDFRHNGEQASLDLEVFGGLASLSAENLETFIELYIAYFNRAPDAVGLGFWGTAFANGMSLEEIAALFVDQDETRETYPETISNSEFAEAVYNNVLGRTPDQSGFDFWTNQLDSGNVSRDQFILEILRGVEPNAPDRDYLDTKVDVGGYFAIHRGMSDPENAASVMSVFDESGVQGAVLATNQYYNDALNPNNGEFLLQVVGVWENPFDFI